MNEKLKVSVQKSMKRVPPPAYRVIASKGKVEDSFLLATGSLRWCKFRYRLFSWTHLRPKLLLMPTTPMSNNEIQSVAREYQQILAKRNYEWEQAKRKFFEAL